jgi:hypothetical protein
MLADDDGGNAIREPRGVKSCGATNAGRDVARKVRVSGTGGINHGDWSSSHVIPGSVNADPTAISSPAYDVFPTQSTYALYDVSGIGRAPKSSLIFNSRSDNRG